MAKWTERFKNGWNAFLEREKPDAEQQSRLYMAAGSSGRPDTTRLHRGNERSIVNAILTRISVDCAQCAIRHVRLDENDRFLSFIQDGLDNCLTIEANIDQTGRAFIQDGVLSMLDEGVVALFPVDVSVNPDKTDSYEIKTMRTAKVLEWFPYDVRIDAYDDRLGIHKQITVPKSDIAIIQNPFYSVMNQPNSTLQRLIRKLNLLDTLDNRSGSEKLDLIIQLPYPVRSESQREKAAVRRKDIEDQLAHSQYGIAYIDAAEHVTQLNRAVENNLLKQVETWQKRLYSQLGMTEEIQNGTADEEAMQNYYNRVVEPIVSAFCDEMKRKFLTETARTQKQSIVFFRDPFKLVPVSKIADVADKFTRNAILSSNEIRGIVGFKPVADAEADTLRNKNLNMSKQEANGEVSIPTTDDYKDGTSDKGVQSRPRTNSRVSAGKATVDGILGR